MFCPDCGKEVAEDQVFCHHCGAKLRAEEGAAPETEISPVSQETVSFPEGAADGGREKTPWEDRERNGFFKGLFRTLNEVLFRPSEFFKKMPVTGGFTDPLLYALIVGMVGVMFSYFWQLSFMAASPLYPVASRGQYPVEGMGIALLAFLTPFFIILALFVSSGLLHLFLLFVKGARAGFEATFRVVAYVQSANVFFVIPACGGIIGFVWAIVLAIIGLREAHEITGGKAAFAVFLPLIILCGLASVAVALFLSLAAASLGIMTDVLR